MTSWSRSRARPRARSRWRSRHASATRPARNNADRGVELSTDDNKLLIDFRLYELSQILQRLLPAEIASLYRNDVRQAFLNDVQLRADRYVFQRHCHLYIAGQVRVIEFVCVTQAFVRNELDIFAAKRIALPGREVSEGHLEGAANRRFQMMHDAGKAVGRQPFRERVRLDKRAIYLLRSGCQDPMQTNGVRGHNAASL